MSIILDIIVVGIVALFVAISVKHGFVRTLIEVIGFVAAMVIALNLGSYLAGAAYDIAIGPKLVTVTGEAANSTANQIVDTAWESLPDFVENSAQIFGITKESVLEKVNSGNGESVAQSVETALNATVRPVFVNIIGMLVAFLLFLALTFVIRIVAKPLNKLFSFGLVGNLNSFLGGVLGLIKGLVFAMIFCIIIGFIVSLSGGFLIFTPENISQTYVFKLLLSITPFNLI